MDRVDLDVQKVRQILRLLSVLQFPERQVVLRDLQVQVFLYHQYYPLCPVFQLDQEILYFLVVPIELKMR